MNPNVFAPTLTGTTMPTKFDPDEVAVAVGNRFAANLVPHRPDPGIPVEGATFGVASMAENSPHGGERHNDGDEILYLISGSVRVVFLESELPDEQLRPGDGLIVPRGIWHRVDILEPAQIVYLTPGPRNEYKPLPDPE